MKVIDLFAGEGNWSAAFRDREHEVLTVEIDERFKPDILADVLDLEPDEFPWRPDIILASPPCEGFSVAAIGKNWTPPPDASAPRGSWGSGVQGRNRLQTQAVPYLLSLDVCLAAERDLGR